MFLKQCQFLNSLLLLFKLCTVNHPNSQAANFSHSSRNNNSSVLANHMVTHNHRNSNNNYIIPLLSTSLLQRDKSSMGQAHIIAGLSRFLLPRSSSPLHSGRFPFQARWRTTTSSPWLLEALLLAVGAPQPVALWVVAGDQAIGVETVVAVGA